VAGGSDEGLSKTLEILRKKKGANNPTLLAPNARDQNGHPETIS
jgi:hypothetical protein